MKIVRIDKLHNCGVFRDFTWVEDTELHEFSRFNLIYGWNGSGKTTISRILRSLELRMTPTDGDITVQVSGRKVNGSEFGQISPETIVLKVFNRDFVKDNVFRPDDGGIAPIVVLGKESIESERKIQSLKAELEVLNDSIEGAFKAVNDLSRRLDRHSQPNARALKDTIGIQTESAYRNYNRGRYEHRADRMMAEDNAQSFRIDAEYRATLTKRQAETLKEPVELPPYEPVDLGALESEASRLLAKTVASEAITSLVDDPPLASWIRQGLAIHVDRSTGECLYCDRVMPTERLEALQKHFDDAYKELLEELDAAIERCETEAASIEAFCTEMPVPEQIYADLSTPYGKAKENLFEDLHQAKSFLDRVIGVLNEKKERAFEPMRLGCLAPPNGGNGLGALVAIVTKHNESCAEFQPVVALARELIEADFIANRLEDYRDIKEEIDRRRLEQAEARERADKIRSEISELEREVLDHRPPADALNADLRDYLGPGALQVAVNERGYTLVRDGRPAHNPSEGEMTAIALLYFLRSLDSRGFNLDRGVVVLDDPVSSLDDNALFTAASYIRRRTQGAGQLIILTHNFAFFREMRNWLRNLKGQRKKDQGRRPAQFYMLRCNATDGIRRSRLRNLDRLLAQYQSEYHYLFSRIYRAANTPVNELEDNYALPNIARRLIEAFLAFKHPQSDNLWEKVHSLDFDEVKKDQILRYLNVYSHNDTIGEPQHDPTLLAESGSVMRNLLELVKATDGQHYDAMVALAKNGSAEASDV